MTLSFTPKYHVEAEPGVWHQLLNTLTPFGRYTSIQEFKRVSYEASDEAATIESQGGKVIAMVFDPKHGDPSKLQAVQKLLK